MSSRRLLVLIEHLPEDSAFKTAASGGDWPIGAQLTTGVWNEVKALRCDLANVPFKPVLSPGAQREREAKRDVTRAAHDEVMAQLRGENQHVAQAVGSEPDHS